MRLCCFRSRKDVLCENLLFVHTSHLDHRCCYKLRLYAVVLYIMTTTAVPQRLTSQYVASGPAV